MYGINDDEFDFIHFISYSVYCFRKNSGSRDSPETSHKIRVMIRRVYTPHIVLWRALNWCCNFALCNAERKLDDKHYQSKLLFEQRHLKVDHVSWHVDRPRLFLVAIFQSKLLFVYWAWEFSHRFDDIAVWTPDQTHFLHFTGTEVHLFLDETTRDFDDPLWSWFSKCHKWVSWKHRTDGNKLLKMSAFALDESISPIDMIVQPSVLMCMHFCSRPLIGGTSHNLSCEQFNIKRQHPD